MSIADTMNKLKSGEVTLEQLLYPGSYLHEVDPNNLAIRVLESGFSTLDEEYMVLKDEGELIVVAGLPSMGKSALAFQIAQHVSRTHPVHVFSLEMNKESIVRRFVSGIINRPITAIQKGLVNSLLPAAVAELNTYNYFIDDRSTLSVDEICDAARVRARNIATKLVVIDYLQIMSFEKGHSRALEIGVATQKLKALCKELKCPVIVLSQLNRQSVLRGGDMKPMLTDLKESGAIEADADIVIAVHRSSRYTNVKHDEAEILVLKNRNGAVGEVTMKFYGAQARFEDIGNEVV